MAVNVEPGTQKFLDALATAGRPPLYTLTPDGYAAVLVEGVVRKGVPIYFS